MPYPLPLTRTEAYLAYKAGVIQQSDLKPSLAVPRNGIDAWLAYWTGIAEDYPKREDGTPHILQEEEAYIAYLCGVLDEYPEKCLRRVGAYLRYIISARWGRPDHPLNREELYLSLIETQFIPSGDPSSDIVIDGTAKAPFVDVKLYGDTYQQSYEGKNQINLTDLTSLGVTGHNNGDGTVTIRGTGSGNASRAIFGASREIEAGTYTLTLSKALPFLVNLSYQGVSFRIAAGSTSATATATSSFGSGNLWMAITGGTTYDETFGIQLTQGSTPDTDFEPYVGGQPSPSPSYPQQIQTVTGRQVVNVTGKNLFDSSKIIIGDIQNANPTIRLHSSQVLWLEAGTYTFSTNLPTPLRYSISTTDVGYPPYASWPTWDYNSSWQSSARKTTFTLTKGGYFNVQLSKPNDDTLTLDEFSGYHYQLEAGSTATDYEPYSSNDYEIDLGSIELCKLGTYQDYIYKDGDDWKIHQNYLKITGLGDSSWIWDATVPRFSKNGAGLGIAGVNADTVWNAVSNKFIAGSFDQVYTNKTNGMAYSTSGFISVVDTSWTDVTTARASLSGGVIYCRLRVPTDTTITDTTLIAQLEALVNGGSEEGTTYIRISATDPNLPAKLYVEAPKYE